MLYYYSGLSAIIESLFSIHDKINKLAPMETQSLPFANHTTIEQLFNDVTNLPYHFNVDNGALTTTNVGLNSNTELVLFADTSCEHFQQLLSLWQH